MDIGARLRDARETRGLTIDALSRATRVQPRILLAIERNDVASLPPRPYGRGFVRAYASEVGLDPDSTVRDFFSQFAPADIEPPAEPIHVVAVERSNPKWRWPLGAIAAYAAIGVLVVVTGRWTMQGADNSDAVDAVGTAGSEAPVPARQSPPERKPVQPALAGVTVTLEARAPAWMSATVDGRRTVYRLLQTGETLTLDGTREVVIRTGDAGAVVWRINGRSGSAMGQPGEVRTVRVTPDGSVHVIAARRPPVDP